MTTDREIFETQNELIDYIVDLWNIKNSELITALKCVPRATFLPDGYCVNVMTNNCIAMPGGYTLSDPGLVAFMVESLALTPNDKVLDIGSGSGYHSALMAALCKEVHGIEILKEGYENSIRIKRELNIDNVHFYHKDGYEGLEKEAPFDAINFACGPKKIPLPLFSQLKVGGRMLLPLRVSDAPLEEVPQQLIMARKVSESVDLTQTDPFKDSLQIETLREVRFMPMAKTV